MVPGYYPAVSGNMHTGFTLTNTGIPQKGDCPEIPIPIPTPDPTPIPGPTPDPIPTPVPQPLPDPYVPTPAEPIEEVVDPPIVPEPDTEVKPEPKPIETDIPKTNDPIVFWGSALAVLGALLGVMLYIGKKSKNSIDE